VNMGKVSEFILPWDDQYETLTETPKTGGVDELISKQDAEYPEVQHAM
jgi:hypothetical protein